MNLPLPVLGRFPPQFCNCKCRYPVLVVVPVPSVKVAVTVTREPAKEIPLSDFENELKRLTALGLEVETAEHAWVHWRSLYVTDPEGNQVELVSYDESI